jgi:hypothetical protein
MRSLLPLVAVATMAVALVLPVRVVAASGHPVRLEKAQADSIVRAIEKDRAETEAWLKSDPTSYLATVERKDFGEKTVLTIGRDPECVKVWAGP